jgi:NTE family protein
MHCFERRAGVRLCGILLALLCVGQVEPMLGQSAATEAAPVERPKVGLVLGGGGALGLAHIGVLLWLQQHHIPVHAITGNSMGSFVGGLYAAGVPIEDIDRLATVPGSLDTALSSQTDYRTLNARRREDRQDMPASLTVGLHPVLPGGVILDKGIYHILDEYLQYVPGNEDFAKLPIPFRTISTDVSSTATISDEGQGADASAHESKSNRYVWCGGDLRTAIRSSISVPGLLSPVVIQQQESAQPDPDHVGCSQWAPFAAAKFDPTKSYQQHQLADGELVDNFPVDLMLELGAVDPAKDVLIGVSFPGSNLNQTSLGLDTMLLAGTATSDTQSELRMRALLRAQPHHLLIVPPTQAYSSADYTPGNVVKMISLGYKAAADAFGKNPAMLQLVQMTEAEYKEYFQRFQDRVEKLRTELKTQTKVSVEVVDGHGAATDADQRKEYPTLKPTDQFQLSKRQQRTDAIDAVEALKIASGLTPLDLSKPPVHTPKDCQQNSNRIYVDLNELWTPPLASSSSPMGVPSPETIAKCANDETIQRALRKMEGTGTYEADYTPSTEGTMLVHLRSFSNGPRFTSVGFEASGETGGVLRGTTEGRFVGPYGHGDELRLSLKVGFLTLLKADNDLPLGDSGFHFVQQFSLVRQPVYFYTGQQRVGEAFEQRFAGGTDVTYQPTGKSLDFRLGWKMGQEYWYQRDGSGAGPYTFTQPLLDDPLTVRLSLTRDTQSASILSLSGGVLQISGGYRFNTGSRSNLPFVTSELSRSINLSAHPPKTCLRNPGCEQPHPVLAFLGSGWVVHVQALGGTDFHRTEAEPYKYAVGGPFELSAYQIGEFRTTDYALGKLYLFKRLFPLPPPFGEGLYVYAGADGGGVFDVQSLALKPASGTVGIAAVTPLGALSLGGAVGAEGHRKVYFTFGKMF